MRHGALCVGLLVILWPAVALAAEDAPEKDKHVSTQQIEATLVNELGAWVAAAMQVPAASKPLSVVASAEKYQQALRVGGRGNRETRFIQLPGAMIFDTDTVDVDNPIIKSQIVHALVHYYQLLNKREIPCAEMREHEAFSLQNRWLEEQGERGYISPLTLARWESCPVAEPPREAAVAVPDATLAETTSTELPVETPHSATEE